MKVNINRHWFISNVKNKDSLTVRFKPWARHKINQYEKKIKTMNSKMTTNSQVSTAEAKNKKKNKLSKQLEQEPNHRNADHTEEGGGRGRMREKVQEIRGIIARYKIELFVQGEAKKSIGNGEIREFNVYDPWT